MLAFAAHVRPELHGVRERVHAVRWRGCDEWGWRGREGGNHHCGAVGVNCGRWMEVEVEMVGDISRSKMFIVARVVVVGRCDVW